MAASLVGVGGSTIFSMTDGCALDDGLEVAFSVGGANATTHRAEIRHGVAEFVGDHAVSAFLAFTFHEILGQYLVGFLAIEVVGVDGSERLVDHILGHQNCVACAPGFHTPFGDTEAFRQLVKGLVDIFNWDTKFLRVVHFLEGLGEVLADDEDHLAETGAFGVVNGIIEDGLIVGADAVHLLQGTVSGTHSSG